MNELPAIRFTRPSRAAHICPVRRAHAAGFVAAIASSWLAGCDLFRCQFGRSADPDERCTPREEKELVLDNLRDRYLFAAQVAELDVAAYDSPEALLEAVTAAVVPPDRFSYIQGRASSDRQAAGLFGGFGVRLAWRPSEGLILARVFGTHEIEPATPASAAGLRRGDVIVAVEGQALPVDDPGAALMALGPDEEGVTRTLRLRRPSGDIFEATLTKRPFAIHTVPLAVSLGDGVGYVLFEAFLERSTEELDAAFASLRGAGVTRLVLDLRWNGGGRGSTSRHLSNLILGEDHDGARAYTQKFNEDYDDCDEHHDLSRVGASLQGIEHVVIITGPGTASASELVWNVLRPYVRVSTVGAPSIGKPYGFFPYEFCGKVLRAVNYRRENAAGQSVPLGGIQPDCPASDEVTGPLGNPSDNLLGLALGLLEGRGCSLTVLTGASSGRARSSGIFVFDRWY